MARKLYEKQAVRRRNGQLANGVALVVYTDEAGTVLADISATSGGSAIAGSTVTTADIAGLGPASLRFWGPTGGTDTLYMRTPDDASLGVQKIEADPDPRLDALEAEGGALHPDLAAHDTLGLATQTELDITKTTIYVKSYVSAPDGTTDNTAGLVAALAAAAGKVLEFEHGKTYVLNTTLQPASDTVIRGNGAAIKAGASHAGNLVYGRHFDLISGRTSILIDGLRFVTPGTAFSTAGENAIIHMADTANCTVSHCRFETITLPSGGSFAAAVSVKGNSAIDNRIIENFVEAAGGIVYSYDGASRTICAFNTVRSAPQNGLSGVGNGGGGIFNESCRVIGNVIYQPGRMGIEDYAQTRDTVIADNTVLSPLSATDGFGISAVGYRTIITGNHVYNAYAFGIEADARGSVIQGNIVRERADDTTIGITVNDGDIGATVQGNLIEATNDGIATAAAVGVVAINGNIIRNTRRYGIWLSHSSGYANVVGNTLSYTIPSVTDRYAIIGAANIVGNTIRFSIGADAGTGQSFGIRPIGVVPSIAFNYIDGGGISSPGPLWGLTTASAPTGIRIIGNTFAGGAAYELTSMVNPFIFADSSTPTDVANAKLGFHGVTPVARASIAAAATDPATTQTLANDLRSKLIALGLVQ